MFLAYLVGHLLNASIRSRSSNYSTVKANMDSDSKAKLTEEELFAQMRWVFSICYNAQLSDHGLL